MNRLDFRCVTLQAARPSLAMNAFVKSRERDSPLPPTQTFDEQEPQFFIIIIFCFHHRLKVVRLQSEKQQTDFKWITQIL